MLELIFVIFLDQRQDLPAKRFALSHF
jgi:hypothetical protein